jgi:hypothetical protein
LNRSKEPLTFSVKKLALHRKTRIVAGEAQLGTVNLTVPANAFVQMHVPRN